MTNLTGRPIVGAISDTSTGPECSCGCGVISSVISQRNGHNRGCKCRSCIGRRNRLKGQEAQRKAFKQAGGTVAFRGQMANEENWRSFEWAPGLRFEMKSGRQVPVWVRNAIAQVQAAHDMGLFRPALMIQTEGSSEIWCLLTLEDMKNQMLALAETGNGWKLKALVRSLKKTLDEMEALV